jgi:glycosyltransferase involved in cell wall biosynthesis
MAEADDTPLVSVIIPTYRRSAFLRRAIESALAQTYSPVEVIVVEDGSHDAREVASSFGARVKYLWQENQGAAVARNTAAAAARGSWLALLDDDDFWIPEKLERQFELVRAFPSVGFVHANYFWFCNGRGEPRPAEQVHSVPSGWVTQQLVLDRFSIGTSTVLVRADLFRKVGGFNPAYRLVQDYDLWIRLSQVAQFGYLATPLAYYEAEAQEELATLCRKSQANVAILDAFVHANPDLCREWPQERLRGRFHRVHRICARRYFAASEIGLARRHFFKAWSRRPSDLSSLAYGLMCLTGQTGIRTLRALYHAGERLGRRELTALGSRREGSG